MADRSKKYLHDQLSIMDGLTGETDWSKARFMALGATPSDDWSKRHMITVMLPEAQAIFNATTTSTTTTTTTSA